MQLPERGFNFGLPLRRKLMSPHDNGLDLVARDLLNQDFNIWASHIDGFDRPAEINGFIPDIVAIKNNQIFVIEIETRDGYKTDHTRQQLTAFSQKYQTILMVPKPLFDMRTSLHKLSPRVVDSRLHQWGLSRVRTGSFDAFTRSINYPKYQ